MAVEISILSGSRQGERLVLESEQFRAGDEPACEVFFNPSRDPSVRGRSLLFRHSEEGWSIVPTGPLGILIDYNPVSGPRSIRSGQVVRMSADGPDFSFRVVAASEARQPVAPTPLASPGWPVGGTGVSPVAMYTGNMPVPPSPLAPEIPPSARAEIDRQTAAMARAGAPASVPVPPVPRSGPQFPVGLFLICTAAGVGIAALAFFLVNSAITVRVQKELKSQTPAVAQQPPETQKPDEPAPKPDRPALPVQKPQAKSETPSDQPWATLEPVKKAIYLFQVEQTMPGGTTMSWPFADCCAIADNVLLTTGNVGCELLRFRHKKFKIYATRPADHVKLEVTDIRIRADYFQHENDRPRQRYCDLALVSVAGRLSSVAPLATRRELVAVEEGVRLGMLGYPHEGSKITPHDEFHLKLTEARVFLVRALDPQKPGTPLCLDLTAEVPPNPYGSAVFTREGKLVGVYNEPPQQDEAHGVKNLHFITAVHPEFIERGLNDRSASLWVEPKVQAGRGTKL